MRLAVVIAANGPKDSPDRLRFAEDDGRRVSSVLADRRGNFQVECISGDTPAAIARGRIFELAENCQPADTFLVHFSGHGRAHNSRLLLQLNGSDPLKPLSTHLDASDLLQAFTDCRARTKFLILDCCNAGAAVRPLGLKGEQAPVKEYGISSNTFEIVMASGFLEGAFEVESLQGGFLSHELCEALSDSFYDADFDKDRAISVDDLMLWLQRRAMQINKGRSPLEQIPIPVRLGFGKGSAYITRPPDEYVIHEIVLPNSTRTVILPILPQRVHRDGEKPGEGVVSMAVHPVTNSQYRRFVGETGYREPKGLELSDSGAWRGPFDPWSDPAFGQADQPVTCVSAEDALVYCKWLLSKCVADLVFGVALPSTPVWNVAAFRFGHWSYPPRDMQAVVHQKSKAPAPCTNAPERTSRLGLTDMFGNVWEWGGTKHEWAKEFLSEKEYGSIFTGTRQSVFSIGGLLEKVSNYHSYRREIRGGGFLDDIDLLKGHLDMRELDDEESTRHTDLGFRVAVMLRVNSLPSEVIERLRDYYPLYGSVSSIW